MPVSNLVQLRDMVFPSIASSHILFLHLKKLLLKLDTENHHLEFLKTCRDIAVIPKFLKSSSRFLSSHFAKEKFAFEMKCLKGCIRRKHGVIARLMEEIYGTKNDGAYYQFWESCTQYEFDLSLKKIASYREGLSDELNKRHSKKITSLTKGLYTPPKEDTPSKILNLSSRTFDRNELELLNKGPKYICQSAPKLLDIIPQLEEVVQSVPTGKQDETRSYIYLELKKHLKSQQKQGPDLRTIKKLKSYPDIVFLPTDKTNKVAVLDKTEYITKVQLSISAMGCSPIQSDPLKSFFTQLEKLKKATWPDSVKNHKKINHLGVIPHLSGVIKDHKSGFPIRPIISRCEAPSFFLEKVLVIVLNEFLQPSSRVLASTNDFVQRMDELSLPPQYFMATLDIISLYPSIDMHNARDIISVKIDSDPNFPTSCKYTIISAINLLISHNYFQFDGQIYQQIKGTPMGSPTSGLFAEFVLRELEDLFLSSCSIQPTAWFRYVDDIFIIWASTTTNFNLFYNKLNSFKQDIKFTYEIEKDGCIPFLDVMLTKKENHISRSVYRKPMSNSLTIPKCASAPNQYKKSAYRSYIRRAFRVCTRDSIHDELDFIRKVAIDNGFSLVFINELIGEFTNKPQPTGQLPTVSSVLPPNSVTTFISNPGSSTQTTCPVPNPSLGSNNNLNINTSHFQFPPKHNNHAIQVTTPKRISVQYIPRFHEKLNHYLHQYNIVLAAKTQPKLSRTLRTNLDPIPPDSKPGIYKIPIILPDGSTTNYIGLTSRKLKHRVLEHKRDVKKHKRCSALTRTHFDHPGSVVKFDEAQVIAPFTNKRKSTLRESIEIYMKKDSVCNEQDSLSIPRIWKTLLV